jgi:hypothetical protein
MAIARLCMANVKAGPSPVAVAPPKPAAPQNATRPPKTLAKKNQQKTKTAKKKVY